MGAGKGDKPRPIDKTKFDNNFDDIQWKKEKTDQIVLNKKGRKTYVYK